jgi:hypothetical protein
MLRKKISKNMDLSTLPPGVTVEYLLQLHRKAEQQRERHRQYLQTDEGKRKNREAAARYYAKNKEKVCEKMREYVADNRETVNERNLAYYHAHREEILAKRAAKNTPTEWLGT